MPEDQLTEQQLYQLGTSVPNLARSEKTLKVIGFYQLLSGGTFVTWLLLLLPVSGIQTTGSQALLGLFFPLLFIPIALTVLAGLYLMQLKPLGFTLSYISLALQVIWIMGPVLSFSYYSGLRLGLFVGGGAWGPSFGIVGTSTFNIASNDANAFGINLLAIALLVLLFCTKKLYIAALQTRAEMAAQLAAWYESHPPQD